MVDPAVCVVSDLEEALPVALSAGEVFSTAADFFGGVFLVTVDLLPFFLPLVNGVEITFGSGGVLTTGGGGGGGFGGGGGGGVGVL